MARMRHCAVVGAAICVQCLNKVSAASGKAKRDICPHAFFMGVGPLSTAALFLMKHTDRNRAERQHSYA